MGVVYYANYLVWFEVGRADWLRQTGWTYREMERDGISLPVIEAQCEYRQPARYDDEIDIATKGTLVTPVRVRFDYELTRAGDDAAIAAGHTSTPQWTRTAGPAGCRRASARSSREGAVTGGVRNSWGRDFHVYTVEAGRCLQ